MQIAAAIRAFTETQTFLEPTKVLELVWWSMPGRRRRSRRLKRLRWRWRGQNLVMRLIPSYESQAGELHTYHYGAMIYRVWSPLSFFMSLQTVSLHLRPAQKYILTQLGWERAADVWTTIGTLLSIVRPLVCFDLLELTSYLNIQLLLSSFCWDYPGDGLGWGWL